jgi:hypothetical protein
MPNVSACMRQICHVALSDSFLWGSPSTPELSPAKLSQEDLVMASLTETPPGYAQESKGPTVLAVCSTLTVVATLFVAGRLYVRTKILARVGLDDWLILLSMVSGFRRASSQAS